MFVLCLVQLKLKAKKKKKVFHLSALASIFEVFAVLPCFAVCYLA